MFATRATHSIHPVNLIRDAYAGAARVAYAVAVDERARSLVAFSADRGEYLHAYGITEADARTALFALAQNFTVGET